MARTCLSGQHRPLRRRNDFPSTSALVPGPGNHDGTSGKLLDRWDFRPHFASLADWLTARRELVIIQWMAVTETNATLRAKAASSLLDHLPPLFDDLIERLRRAPPVFVRLEAQAGQHAREHAICRWHQGFVLDEMLGDLATLRTLLIDHLAIFEAGDFKLHAPACSMAQRTVHGFLETMFPGRLPRNSCGSKGRPPMPATGNCTPQGSLRATGRGAAAAHPQAGRRHAQHPRSHQHGHAAP